MVSVAWGWRPVSLKHNSLSSLLSSALEAGFTFVSVPLVIGDACPVTNISSLTDIKALQSSLVASSDYCLGDDWFNRVILELPSGFNSLLLQLAAHLSVCGVIMKSFDEASLVWHQEAGKPFNLWFECRGDFQSWQAWRTFVSSLNDSSRIGVVLHLNDNFHPVWIAERIGAVIVESDPSALHLIWQADPNCPVIISAKEPNLLPFKHLQPKADEISAFAGDLRNVLQSPLQPLKDHLPAETYRVFEMDPVKYRLYQEAITLAISEIKSSEKVRIGVFGAGRGPLVQATLDACEQANVKKYQIIVMEKNPFAMLTLLDRFRAHAIVELIFGDMRAVEHLDRFDVIVSELLGSFGCNELSPECLWSIERFLKPNGVMIPQSYTSYIQPAFAPLLRESAQCELPYVAYISKAYFWDTQPKPVFTFNHPSSNHESIIDTQTIAFSNLPDGCIVDSLVGYFDCTLYGPIEMSTLPESHSPGMLSWFPAFFPLKERFMAKNLSIQFRRQRQENKIWYEWRISDGPWCNLDGLNHQMLL